MSRYFEDAAVRNQEDSVARVLESGATTAVLFSDDFNRANGALGAGWTTTAGSVVISGNKALPVNTFTNDSVRAVTPGISANQWAEGYITAADTYSWLVVRGNSDDSNRYFFVCGRSLEGSRWVLTRSVGGSDTDLATGANSSGVTGTYRLEAEGSTIRCYINGTKVAEVTDSSLTTGGIGFGFYTTGAGGSVDNFRGGDLPYVPLVGDQTFTDDFNRADGDLGSNWVTVSGVPNEPVISGNHVIPSGTAVNNGVNVVGTYGANQWARIAASLGADYSEAGVLLHSTDADHTMSFIYTTDGEPYGPGVFGSVNGPAVQLYFLYGAGPVFRFLGETSAPGTGTHVVFACNVGRQFQFWFDGVRAFNVDDSAHTELPLVSAPGFTIHRAGTGVETIVDDFAGGDWVTGPATPTITSLTPSSIDAAGGTVTVSGANFIKDATMATIGGTNYAVTVTSPTSGTFTAPAHAAGNVTVTVTSVGGTSAGSTLTYTAVPANTGTAAVTYTESVTAAVGKKTPQGSATVAYTEGVTSATGKRSPKATVATTYTEGVAAAGARTSNGAATVTYGFSVVAAGARAPKSAATVTYTVSTSAVGKRAPKAQAATVHAWGLLAQGVAPIVGVKQGTAAVSHIWATAAAGQRSSKASAALSYIETLVANGKKIQQGAGLTTWTGLVTTATGKRVPKATAAATVVQTLAATGVAPIVGVKQGTAAVSWSGTVTAPGKRTPKALAAVTYVAAVAAIGNMPSRGSAVVAHIWSIIIGRTSATMTDLDVVVGPIRAVERFTIGPMRSPTQVGDFGKSTVDVGVLGSTEKYGFGAMVSDSPVAIGGFRNPTDVVDFGPSTLVVHELRADSPVTVGV